MCLNMLIFSFCCSGFRFDVTWYFFKCLAPFLIGSVVFTTVCTLCLLLQFFCVIIVVVICSSTFYTPRVMAAVVVCLYFWQWWYEGKPSCLFWFSNFTNELNIFVILNISRLLALRITLMLDSENGNLFEQCVIFVTLITLCLRSLKQFTTSVVGKEYYNTKWLWGTREIGMVFVFGFYYIIFHERTGPSSDQNFTAAHPLPTIRFKRDHLVLNAPIK